MIFNNIEFHNVEEMKKCEKGYMMYRLPAYVREKINSSARDETSLFSTGVELRFRIKGDYATVILSLGDNFSLKLFEERVKVFTDILGDDPRPIFATSIFGITGLEQEKASKYREIVRKYASKKLIFTDGLELLDNPAYIAADLVHPTLEGINQISERWSTIMKKTI